MGLRRHFDADSSPDWNRPVTKADLYDCYRLFLGRVPDPDGWRHHLEQFDGVTLARLVERFVCSDEFRNSPTYAALLGEGQEADAVLVEFSDRAMYVDPTDPTTSPILDHAQWEPEVTAVFERLLEPGWTVLDIGANVGFFALLAATRVGNEGRVIAFEPGSDNCGLLQLSIVANGFEHVTLLPLALSDRTTTLQFERLVGSNAVVRSVDSSAPVRIGGRRQLVQGVRLDDLPLGLDRLDLVKIDIEGAELRALRGASELLRQFRPLIISEFSPHALQSGSGANGEDFVAFLADVGYRDVAIIQHDGSLMSCGIDGSAAVDAWRRSERQHVDVLVSP